MSSTATCPSCGTKIRWAKSPEGRAVMLLPQPSMDGTMRLTDGVVTEVDAAHFIAAWVEHVH